MGALRVITLRAEVSIQDLLYELSKNGAKHSPQGHGGAQIGQRGFLLKALPEAFGPRIRSVEIHEMKQTRHGSP